MGQSTGQSTVSPTRYIGRFAPSPTGPLHLGSMLTALASYLDAKSQQGAWKVRIDDLDPPREVPGASAQILKSLEKYHLYWDDEVIYQSQRQNLYQDYVQQCLDRELAFPCRCSRQEIQSQNGIHQGACHHAPGHHAPDTLFAIRMRAPSQIISFEDQCQGHIQQCIASEIGDFVIKRKDGFFAYHLACAVDDHLQNITHIVRGRDLIDSTPRQIYLQHLFGFTTPNYLHLPIIVNEHGQKLSKQTFACDIEQFPVNPTLTLLMEILGIFVPTTIQNDTALILQWGIDHWHIKNIIHKQEILASSITNGLTKLATN